MPSSRQSGTSTLEIASETVLVEVPRGRDGREVLRLTFTKALTPEGKDVAWHSLRLFWKDDAGEFRPGKQGITIRGAELKPITEALLKATAGGRAPSPLREPLPDEVYAARRGRDLR